MIKKIFLFLLITFFAQGCMKRPSNAQSASRSVDFASNGSKDTTYDYLVSASGKNLDYLILDSFVVRYRRRYMDTKRELFCDITRQTICFILSQPIYILPRKEKLLCFIAQV